MKIDNWLLQTIETRFQRFFDEGIYQKKVSVQEMKNFNGRYDFDNLKDTDKQEIISFLREKLDIPKQTLMECWINKCKELL